MKVDLFSIGRYTIHSYGLMIAIGIIVAIIFAMKQAKKAGLNPEEIINMTILAVVCGFAGSKSLFILENFQEFLVNPKAVIGSNGFVVYGSLVTGLISVVIYCKVRKLPFWRFADVMFPFVALAQGIGRIGCFFAGCCYGKPTDAWWGVTFPEGCYAPAGIPLIPTQLISAVGDVVIMALLLLVASKAKKVGDVSAFYLIFYGIGRFLVEFLRTNTQGGSVHLTTAQLMSFGFIAAGIILLAIFRIYKKQESYDN